MRGEPVHSPSHAGSGLAVPVAVALLSAGLIAYEVVLMRRLLIERWHHFGYLVISVALLGFGASGTLLALVERRVRRRPVRAMCWCTVGLGVALLAMPRIAVLLPATARFIPDDLWRQVGWWSLYWLTAMVPFLLGALMLATALMTAGPRVGRVYAANLFGSGIGAAGAALLVSRFALEHTLWPSFVLTLLAAALLLFRRANRDRASPRVVRGFVVLALAGLGAAAEVHWPLVPHYDEHKYAARLQQLAAQGSARRVAMRSDPQGYVELYESDLFHDLPFLALSTRPPSMYSLVINGDPAGSVLRIDGVDEAGVMDGTLMALPYTLIPPAPGVLLIGEMGGANVWLARRRQAARVDVVQPNAAVVALLRRFSPPLFDDPHTRFEIAAPRHFLATLAQGQYDLIQVAALEGLGVGAAGMRGLAEDHLATVEGFAACLRRLTDRGVLAVSRGIQQPPRENIRLLATLVEALESLGVENAAQHIIQVRDYLGVCTLALRSPLSPPRRDALRAAIRDFNLTPVWYDGLPTEAVNQPDALAGPPGTPIDWLHHAAREIFSPRRAQFYESWLLNVQPPHDDNPFFWDFYKPRAVAALRQAYGDLWLTRAELGRLFLYASLAIAGVAAIVLILLPLGAVELRRRRARGRAPAAARGQTLCMVVYFAGIGLGFMGLEMALISRAIHWLGDPVLASACVIGGMLVVSGFGSLTATRILRGPMWPLPALVACLALALRLIGWGTSSDAVGPWPLLLIALPAAYFMGMPMPTGLAHLDRRAPRLIPWAWGINGVASVIATSAAIVVALSAGYRTVVLLAALAYAAAAVAGLERKRRDVMASVPVARDDR